MFGSRPAGVPGAPYRRWLGLAARDCGWLALGPTPEQHGGQVAVDKIAYPSIEERGASGLAARERAPWSGHAGWSPAADRPDPVALIEQQDATRMPGLVPVRHGRMMVSPFTLYRGAAKIMAADLAVTPVAGLEAQLCGDAHSSRPTGRPCARTSAACSIASRSST
jgi:Uncharacterized protein conserved in bacteria (DUF2252)